MTDPSPYKHPISDSRVQEILAIVEQLRVGNQQSWPSVDGHETELESAIIGLKNLTATLTAQRDAYQESERRLGEIMDVITAISFLDFSKRVPVGDEGDILDAVASGLNMLGEELVATTVSKTFFTQIVESMIETLIVLGPDATIKLVNRAATELLGYSEDELLGQPIQKVFGEEFRADEFNHLLQRGFTRNEERVYQTKAGRRIPVSFSASVMASDEELQGIVCVARDITNRKQAEEVIRRANEELRRLARELGATNRRLLADLALAHDIQLGLMPDRVPWDTAKLAIHSRCIPAAEVGGDFYTYIALDDHRMAIAIGDISGKGVAAALIMALVSSTIEIQAPLTASPADLLGRLNRQLTPRLQANHMNAAVLYALVDLEERRLYVANAGMIAPILLRQGQLAYLDANGLPIGALVTARYEDVVVELEPGDSILLVSDGIVEAHNRTKELYGFERLERIVSQGADIAQGSLVDYVLGNVAAFVAGGAQHDDMTMISISPVLADVEALQLAVR